MKHIHQKFTEGSLYTVIHTSDVNNIEIHPSLLEHPEIFEGPPPPNAVQLIYQSSIGEE